MMVDVAVAQMPEGQSAYSRKGASQPVRVFGDKGRHQVDGHADVMLQCGAFGAFGFGNGIAQPPEVVAFALAFGDHDIADQRSEEHTSELQSLMRISYAVFCLKKKKTKN